MTKKEIMAGIIYSLGFLAACMAGGKMVVQVPESTELIIRTGLVCSFGVSSLIANHLLNKK